MCNDVALLVVETELLALGHGVDPGLGREEVLVSVAGLGH